MHPRYESLGDIFLKEFDLGGAFKSIFGGGGGGKKSVSSGTGGGDRVASSPRGSRTAGSANRSVNSGSGATAAQRSGTNVGAGTAGGDSAASGLRAKPRTPSARSTVDRAKRGAATTPVSPNLASRVKAQQAARTNPSGSVTPSSLSRAGSLRRGRASMNAGQRASSDRYSGQARAAGKPPSSSPSRPGTSIKVTNPTSNYLSAKRSAAVQSDTKRKQAGVRGRDAADRGRLGRSVAGIEGNAAGRKRYDPKVRARNQGNAIAGSLRFNQDRGRQAQGDQAAHAARTARTSSGNAARDRAAQAAARGRRTTTSGAGRARFHTVKKGDTLGALGKRYGQSVDKLRSGNPDVDPRRMQIGSRIRLGRHGASGGGGTTTTTTPKRSVAPPTTRTSTPPTPRIRPRGSVADRAHSAAMAATRGNRGSGSSPSGQTAGLAKGSNPIAFSKEHGITLKRFYELNPSVKGKERRLQIGQKLRYN